MEKTHTISTPTGDIVLSTGKIANLSAGAVMVQKGGTVILATADVDAGSVNQDFFPLTVEYLERYYATGVMSGSRFNKREGFPNEDAIISARVVDHSIRPLFPKSFTQPVNVILTLLAHDPAHNPEGLLVLAASAALGISGIPFAGPAANTVVGVRADGSIVLNPTEADHDFVGHFSVAGTSKAVLSIEGWGKELADEVMDEVLDKAIAEIAKLNEGQIEFAKGVAKPRMEFVEAEPKAELVDKLLGDLRSELEKFWYTGDKKQRDENRIAFEAGLRDKLVDAEAGITGGDVMAALDYASKKLMREGIIKSDKRFSGRKLDEIRPLSAEVDVLPTVHGSALFTRGHTQSLSVATLGSTAKSKGFDDMQDMDTVESFLHHYNFPPFSTGEAGKVKYKPGRREIGHGNIGFNALRHMIPSQEEFPYTIRVVSEIVTSNGSTSMAATCGASMALMAAGVPLKAAVGGIGVGLITTDDTQSDYKLLLDIEGVEDFYGDMDFKVTGSRKGITAIQFETKLQGVLPSILKEAFRLSNKGREQVLDVMDKAISESRKELSPSAPRVEVMTVPVDKIGEVIGPSGKVIKAIIARASQQGGGQPEIDIADDGRVTITAGNQTQLRQIMDEVDMIVEGPKVGLLYTGPVTKITEFGAFVEIVPGIEGLLHISEIAKERVERVEDYLKIGQEITVKMIDKKPGRYSLSLKAAQAEQK